jgi:isoleucyl-tRNA synthetase
MPGTSPAPRRGSSATTTTPTTTSRSSTSSTCGSTAARPTPSCCATADGSEDGIADLYLEGTDQHRGWFHSSMLQACGTIGPRALSRRADPRLHAGREGQQDVQVARQHHRARGGHQAVRRRYPAALGGADGLHRRPAHRAGDPERAWPTATAACATRCASCWARWPDFTEADRVRPADMPELERWVLHRLAELDAAGAQGLRAYDFQGVFQRGVRLRTVDLSAFYFDIRKDALYCDGDSLRRRRRARCWTSCSTG